MGRVDHYYKPVLLKNIAEGLPDLAPSIILTGYTASNIPTIYVASVIPTGEEGSANVIITNIKHCPEGP